MIAYTRSSYIQTDRVSFAVEEYRDADDFFIVRFFERESEVLSLCGLSRKNLEQLESAIRAALIDSEEVCLGDGVQEAPAR